MIADVYLTHSTYAEPPSRFEVGTPAIGEAIGLGAAIDYLSGIGMQKIHDYELELSNYLYEELSSIPGVHIYGAVPSKSMKRAALCSFNVKDISPHRYCNFSGPAARSSYQIGSPLCTTSPSLFRDKRKCKS